MRAYKRLRVRLKKADRDKLDDVLSGGLQPVRTVLRALALSHLHDEKPVSEVAAIVRLTPKGRARDRPSISRLRSGTSTL
jgi:hypothetical protein